MSNEYYVIDDYIFDDTDLLHEYIFDRLGRYNKFPSESAIEYHFEEYGETIAYEELQNYIDNGYRPIFDIKELSEIEDE